MASSLPPRLVTAARWATYPLYGGPRESGIGAPGRSARRGPRDRGLPSEERPRRHCARPRAGPLRRPPAAARRPRRPRPRPTPIVVEPARGEPPVTIRLARADE